MKTTFTKVFGLLLAVSLLGACTTRKTITYLQDVELAKQYTVEHDRETKLQVGDRLQIKVQSAFPELVAPFNGGGYAMPGQAQATAQNLSSIGYTIRRDGTIDFPVLGRLRIEGMTTSQVADMLRERIVAGKYVTDPNVTVVFDNFTIYLLGAVGESNSGSSGQQSQGGDYVYTSYNMTGGGVLRVRERDKVNILEAIAMTGDLPVYAKIDRVNVIREEGGKYTTYRLNLKSANIFESPAFYLKQHDIVYVEHRYKGERSFDRAVQISSLAFSTVTSVVALVALFRSK